MGLCAGVEAWAWLGRAYWAIRASWHPVIECHDVHCHGSRPLELVCAELP
jgi:hypothetical protein